jgi:hypothetical protein
MRGVQKHHRRNYRNRRQGDNECERYQLAEQELGGLARRNVYRRAPAMQQVGEPAEIDEHVIALSVRRSW